MSDPTDTETLAMTSPMALRSLLGRMSPAERAAGRYLRAPDGHDGDGGDPGAGDEGGDEAGGDGGDQSADQSNVNDQAKSDEDEDSSLISKAGEDKAGDPDPATLPPEKYELTAPEGFAVDETVMAEADPVFRDLGLTNEQANKLMPLAGKFADRIAAAQNDAFQAMKTDWAKEAKADKELGGANWAETESLVAKALDTAAAGMGEKGPERVAAFKALLDETGIGNRADLIHVFRWFGSQMGEGGGFARSDAGATVKPDRLATLYPNDVPNKEPA